MSPAIGALKKKSEANRKGQKRNLNFEEIFFFFIEYRQSMKSYYGRKDFRFPRKT